MGAALAIDDIEEMEEATAEGRFDPYLQFAEMPYTATFYPLGFPVEIKTNHAAVLELAEQSWREFRQAIEMPPIRIQLGVRGSGGGECPSAPLSRAMYNVMVRIADAENFYIVDLLQGFSFGWVNQATLSHPSYLRYHYLEAAALTHIANRHSTPIHAACVDRNGHGVLLCGESGAGKSSLAFACARAGWTYVTDDASFLLHGESERWVHGNCHMVRLRPSAADLFDEVVGRPLTPRLNGKPSIEIPMSALPEIKRAPKSNVKHIVFLNRDGSQIQTLLPYSSNAARSYVDKHLCGMDQLRALQLASVDRLLTAPILELRYHDMNWAVDRLERLVQES